MHSSVIKRNTRTIVKNSFKIHINSLIAAIMNGSANCCRNVQHSIAPTTHQTAPTSLNISVKHDLVEAQRTLIREMTGPTIEQEDSPFGGVHAGSNIPPDASDDLGVRKPM